jgi:PAS domain S-box-containing protein
MLVAVGLIAIWTLRQVDDSDSWVEHTREVIQSNRQLLSDLKDAESAERGYIITGDEKYLEGCRLYSADIAPVFTRLERLVSDNPLQRTRARDMMARIDRRMAVMNHALEERREHGFEAALAVVLSGNGRVETMGIRDVSQTIEDEEYRLLDERSRLRQHRMQAGLYSTIIALLLALSGFVMAAVDVRSAVKQRDRAQAVSRESESTSHALFEAAAQAIFIVDPSGKIVAANPAVEKIFGYSPGELIGQNIDLLVPEKLRGIHVGHRNDYFHHPQNRPMGMGLDLQARRKDGTGFYAEISLSHIQTRTGTMAVAFVTDISRRREDSEAILQQKEALRQLATRMMTAQDDERRRIARDLHDDLSQKLAYLSMDIGKLGARPSAKEFLGDLHPLQMRAAEAAETVRRISHQLHPAVLDDIGLEAAIEQYCEEFEERYGIATEFTCRNIPDSLSSEVAGSLYHIFQECLRNVSKHSKAEVVVVTLEAVDSVLRLVIKDEGVGLSDQRASGSSIGILSMRERANLVNGTLSIQSKLGAGTEISVEVPLAT